MQTFLAFVGFVGFIVGFAVGVLSFMVNSDPTLMELYRSTAIISFMIGFVCIGIAGLIKS